MHLDRHLDGLRLHAHAHPLKQLPSLKLYIQSKYRRSTTSMCCMRSVTASTASAHSRHVKKMYLGLMQRKVLPLGQGLVF